MPRSTLDGTDASNSLRRKGSRCLSKQIVQRAATESVSAILIRKCSSKKMHDFVTSARSEYIYIYGIL